MLFVDYIFEKSFGNILFDKELKPSDLGVQHNDMYQVSTDNNRVVFRKFELEDTVIKLHEIARYIETTTAEVEIAKKIRQMADEVSDKLKRVGV